MSLHSCQESTTALNSTERHIDLLNKDMREKKWKEDEEKRERLISERRKQNERCQEKKKKEINNKVV